MHKNILLLLKSNDYSQIKDSFFKCTEIFFEFLRMWEWVSMIVPSQLCLFATQSFYKIKIIHSILKVFIFLAANFEYAKYLFGCVFVCVWWENVGWMVQIDIVRC